MREYRLNTGAPQRADARRRTLYLRPDDASPRLFHHAEVLAASLPPLLIAAERVAATVSQGVHGRRRVGQGETFWQYRRYQPGDPIQRIDWRKSAKSRHVHLRQTEWEAAQSVWLWRDASPSMSFQSRVAWPTKRERAEILLLALASLLARGGEHFALLGQGEPPSAGRVALRRIAESIDGGRVPTANLPANDALPRYSRLVLIGDLLSPLDEIRRIVSRYAAQGVRGHLLQVLDPAEESLPYAGRVLFEGPEGDGETLIGRVEDVRAGYRELMAAHKQGLIDATQSVGWTFAVHHTDKPPQPALLALFLLLSEQAG
ncbi:MAG: DUF58 domain-containing protein [Rhodospirillales bacterium]|nr:DUF58 domain-containing protein [Rhodospirillales bacterium]